MSKSRPGSNTYETIPISSRPRILFEVAIIRLHGREIVERLARPVVAVVVLELFQREVKRFHVRFAFVELVEFVA